MGVLNSSSYKLLLVNDVRMSFDLEKLFCKELNEVQAGFSDCSEKVITAYLPGCWKAGRLQPAGLIVCQKVFLEWHSGGHVEHVQRCTERFEWLEKECISPLSYLYFQLVRLSVIEPIKDEINSAIDLFYRIKRVLWTAQCGVGGDC